MGNGQLKKSTKTFSIEFRHPYLLRSQSIGMPVKRMIPIKNAKEIEIMREGGRRLAQVLEKVLKAVKPGISLKELDQLAGSLIEKKGGKPSFKMVKGYNWPTCINVNQGVVHGVPTEYRLKDGNIVSVDTGMFYQGLHTDMARTLRVGAGDDIFLKTGQRALKEAIKAAKPGSRVGHISAAIEKVIRKAGFTPIQALTGHGVGKKLHEEPQIPCFLKDKVEDTPQLKPGMILAIEVIYAQGEPEVVIKDDGWTVETADGQLAGLFEDTIAVTAKGALNFTRLDKKPQV